ncbi:MAG TPA: hypothetical protein VK837_01925 [Longimicrobiales bacterium]|nr:hypothetical protein [Longimicrobiales bacterium]
MKTVADPGVTASLVARLRRLRPDSPRRWGTLTPQEMLCHLGDTSEGVLGERPKPLRGPLRDRPLLKLAGLWFPFPWRGRSAGAWNDPHREGTRPSDFERDRERAIRGVESIARSPEHAELAPGHGIFGAMSSRDWKRYTYRHTHYHLRQFGL